MRAPDPTGLREGGGSMWMGWAIDRPRRVIFVGCCAGVRDLDGGLVGLIHGPLGCIDQIDRGWQFSDEHGMACTERRGEIHYSTA
jgi:hypothetical protein